MHSAARVQEQAARQQERHRVDLQLRLRQPLSFESEPAIAEPRPRKAGFLTSPSQTTMTSLDPFPLAPHHIPDRPVNEQGRPVRQHLPVPDLRFEQSFLRSIEKHIHVRKATRVDEKGQERDDLKAVTHTEGPIVVNSLPEVTYVDWGAVLWITFRDQLFSPCAQGAIWCDPGHNLLQHRTDPKLCRALILAWGRPVVGTVLAHARNFFSPSPNTQRLRSQGWGVQGLQGRFR
jgi:hypothetical protein